MVVIGPKERVFPYVILSTFILIVASICVAESRSIRMPFIFLNAAVEMILISISTLSFDQVKYVLISLIGLDLLVAVGLVLEAFHLLPPLPSKCFMIACPVLVAVLFVVYIIGIWRHLRNLKSLLRGGGAWANVNLCVDSIYILLPAIYTMLYITVLNMASKESVLVGVIFSALYFSLIVALILRMRNESLFVCWKDHERVIVESMRVTHIDNGHDTEASGTTLLYKGIYDRVLEYFNNEKPYLNSSLTINDVVEVVFSNKLYISRAISQFGGKNFCQFVNYYRIVHSLELFRQNPTMKISDLAIQSGFNSAVSFGMAFNLFMGQKPGDWCRRERYRLEKLKK
jgi:AraC-like DNA-binding protein